MPKTYGYCRISTPKQNLERQIRNIKEAAPDAIIVAEAYSGRVMARPQWQKLFKAAQAGDTIIFDSVSRMSRDADEGVKTYMELYKRGVNLRFLKEPGIDTHTYERAAREAVPLTGTSVDLILDGVNRYLMVLAEHQIRLAFMQSQKELDDLRQRTREGLMTAKLNGSQVGAVKGAHYVTRKSIEAKKIIWEQSRQFAGNLKDADVLKLAGISRRTLYAYKRELAEAGEPPKDTTKATKKAKTSKATSTTTTPAPAPAT